MSTKTSPEQPDVEPPKQHDPPPTAWGSNEGTSMVERGKDAIVTFVSMKLKQFDKPFLLALLIGFFQLPILIVLFWYLGDSCQTQSLLAPNAVHMMKEYVKLGTPCVESAYASASPGPGNDRPFEIDWIKLRECKFGGGDGRYLDSITWCSQALKDRQSSHDVFEPGDSLGCPWNPAKKCHGLGQDLISLEAKGKVPVFFDKKVAVPHSMVSEYTECVAHDAARSLEEKQELENSLAEKGEHLGYYPYKWTEPFLLNSSDYTQIPGVGAWLGNAEGQQLLYYQICPAPASVLAMTLGYAGFVELGLTIIIVGVLWAVRIVKLKDSEAGMKSWLADYFKAEGGMGYAKKYGKDAAGKTMDKVMDD